MYHNYLLNCFSNRFELIAYSGIQCFFRRTLLKKGFFLPTWLRGWKPIYVFLDFFRVSVQRLFVHLCFVFFCLNIFISGLLHHLQNDYYCDFSKTKIQALWFLEKNSHWKTWFYFLICVIFIWLWFSKRTWGESST